MDADRFRLIEAPVGSTRFHTFLRRLNVLDIVVFHPLLLELMGRPGSDEDDRNRAARALESYLIRRVVCGYQTRGYSTLALSLLDRVASLPPESVAAPTLIAVLAEASTGLDRWPDDGTFKAEWVRKKFYGNLRRNRVAMILQAIEEHYQRLNSKSEPVLSFNFAALEIEHIMPQGWDIHWTLNDPAVTREDRDWALHGIGNLTLIGAPLNKSMSHGPWTAPEGSPSKRKGLGDHSKLELNARLLRDHPADWDEKAMRSRAERLFEAAVDIWPSPTALV
jgi:hypothetical protein